MSDLPEDLKGIVPEWSKLLKAGWRFDYSTETRFLGATHPSGGKFSICEFNRQLGDRETLAHQIGFTMATLLNDGETVE